MSRDREILRPDSEKAGELVLAHEIGTTFLRAGVYLCAVSNRFIR